jgi:hypothetical protein
VNKGAIEEQVEIATRSNHRLSREVSQKKGKERKGAID